MKELKETEVCYHCGTTCDNHAIRLEEKSFCCSGCQTVYEILDENGLTKYYDLEFTPGKSMKEVERTGKFDYLNDELLQTKILDYKSPTLCKVSFRLPQIHCSSCVWLLENLYKLNDGVLESRVNFMKRKASIDFDPEKISLKALVVLLTSIGYEPDIKLNDAEEKTPKADKRLWYKLGVAGFCFGNIMFLSLPEYFSSSGYLREFFGGLFGYLNILLGLPVFLYSATDYFKAAWLGLKKKHLSLDVPISVGIVTLFAVSLLEIIGTTGTGYFDSLAGLVFFLLLGKVFQQKSFQTLSFDRNYKSYFPLSVTLVQENEEVSIPLEQLKKGDAIHLRNGELIPADAILLTSHAQIDYSFVTGEAEPVEVVAGEIIYAGGRMVGQLAKMEVIKNVSQSYLVELWNNKAFDKDKAYSLEKFSNNVSKYFTIIILAIAFISAGFWLTKDTEIAIKVFTSVLIVACPCALALSIPFVYGNALRILAHHRFYLRNIGVIDNMTHIKSIVFDKTGTLTNGSKAEITYSGKPLTVEEKILVKSVIKNSTHPLSRKLFQYLEGSTTIVEECQEIPGKGITAKLKGHSVIVGSASFVFEDSSITSSGVYVKIDGIYIGCFSFRSALRSGVASLIKRLAEKYTVYLLSGDKAHEKATMAQELGEKVKLFFDQSPHDKLEKIAVLQHQHQVMMLGDGLNDAGALQQSNVGIAVTDDVSVFTPASDAILVGERVNRLEQYLQFAKASRKMVIASFIISFLYNLVGLFFAVQGILSPVVAAVLMPVSSLSVVVFAFVSTYYLARRLKR